jgi:hypothetical protein
MSKVVYEVVLNPDGKHSVSVKSDDPILLKDALPLAKKIQDKLLLVDGSKAPSAVSQPSTQGLEVQQPQAPLCAIHKSPMVKMEGKFGSFWSCHRPNPDGSWCTYRPPKSKSNGSPTSLYHTA